MLSNGRRSVRLSANACPRAPCAPAGCSRACARASHASLIPWSEWASQTMSSGRAMRTYCCLLFMVYGLWFIVYPSLIVVCCLWFMVYCVLFMVVVFDRLLAVCCLWFMIRCSQFIVCCLWFAVCDLLFTVYCLLFMVYDLLFTGFFIYGDVNGTVYKRSVLSQYVCAHTRVRACAIITCVLMHESRMRACECPCDVS